MQSDANATQTDGREKPASFLTSGRIKAAAKLLITGLLFVLLFSQIHWSAIWTALQTIDGTLLFWTCVMWIPTQYLQFLRWDLLAREAGAEVSRRDIHRGYWVGFTLGLITPGRVGEVGRALALHNCPLPRAIGLSAMERAYSAIAMNSFGLLSLVILPRLGWVPPFHFSSVLAETICLVAGLSLLLLGIFPRTLTRPLRWLADKIPLREKIHKAIDPLQLAHPGRSLLYLGLAIISMFTALFQFVLLLRAMGADVPALAGMLAAQLTFFIKGALPFTIGSLGIGEWTAVYCFAGLGITPSVAVAASLLLFFINVFIPSLIGLPFMSTLRVPSVSKPGTTSA
jgi:uncharacterized protein (TIRG00374 family)